MDHDEMEQDLRNLDRRVDRIEQILPNLATKDDLQAAIEPLATKAELQAAIEPLATKAELQAAIDKAVEPLATKAGLQSAVAGAEHRMRTHFDVATESLHDDIRLIAEGLAVLSQKVDQNHSELKTDIAGLDRRLMRIEAGPARA